MTLPKSTENFIEDMVDIITRKTPVGIELNGKKVYVRDRFAGILTKDRNFICWFKPSHKFKMYDSWGKSKSLINWLFGIRVKKIILNIEENKETIKILETTPEEWVNEGIRYEREGYEPQLHLPEDKFRVVK